MRRRAGLLGLPLLALMLAMRLVLMALPALALAVAIQRYIRRAVGGMRG